LRLIDSELGRKLVNNIDRSFNASSKTQLAEWIYLTRIVNSEDQLAMMNHIFRQPVCDNFFFPGFSPQPIIKVLVNCETRVYSPGEYVYHQEQISDKSMR